MQHIIIIQPHTFSCSTSTFLNNAAVPFKTLSSSSSNKPLYAGTGVIFRHMRSPLGFKQMSFQSAVNSSSEEQNSSTSAETTRKVIEHICLLKAKADLSDEDEKDMLDFLYTCQYQMPGILAISLGRISYQKLESYTHAVFMRFQKKEDLAKFYENPFYLGVLKDHVTPYCHELTFFDYESEVEDDILPIFRKGEEFNFGVEFILLLAFKESSLGEVADDALTSLSKLLMEFPSLIVQATKGSNFNPGSKDYTHAIVIRFRSCELCFQSMTFMFTFASFCI
ncbi:dimeric alpha-beta barrel [Artemisia annua]|uniref:Dimeric alpha-beta barrel n=1 Tax=Artemisia annua TaxID=35608 RepID=A0A2U1KPL4_ARTAN|nr:dimeric alpha-beta barrel [Artemisia annua]